MRNLERTHAIVNRFVKEIAQSCQSQAFPNNSMRAKLPNPHSFTRPQSFARPDNGTIAPLFPTASLHRPTPTRRS